MTYKNITLIGASGSIGSIILNGLIQASEFTVSVVSRTESPSTFPPGITVHKSDFSDTHLQSILHGQDAVISALGATGFNEQKKLVDAAIAAGVKLFIPSEFSASSQTEAVLELLPLFRQKYDLIAYLRTREASISWTGIATSGLFDWGLRNGFLEFDIPTRAATIWDDGNKSFTLTNENALSDAVVSVLRRPEVVQNEYIYIYSVQTTQNEILRALESATGAAWTVKKTTTEEQVREGRRRLAEGDFGGAFALVRATVFGAVEGLTSDYVRDLGVANGRIGVLEDDVDGTVGRAVGV